MKEFRVNDGGPFTTAVGSEFDLIVSTYATVRVTETHGAVDYLGQSIKPGPPGLCGAPMDVALRFKARQKGDIQIGINVAGRSYETNMEVDEQNMEVRVIAA